LELKDTDASKKQNYKEELFKIIKGLEAIDGADKSGNEVDSTVYDDEDEEFDDGDDGKEIFKFRW
jgi:hypothetical protein